MIILEKLKANISSLEELLLLIRISFLVTILPIMLKRLSVSKLMQVFTPRNTISYKKKNIKKHKENIVKFTDYNVSESVFPPWCEVEARLWG